jgi:hypothetical protein
VDASSATEPVTGLASALRPARRVWMSSLESVSSAASLDIWQDTAVAPIPDVLMMDPPVAATTIVDPLLLPATVAVAARPSTTDVTPMTMDTAVATPDRPTVVMVDPADTASARPTTPAVVTEATAATVDALPLPITAMVAVDARPAPMGKFFLWLVSSFTMYMFCRLFFCFFFFAAFCLSTVCTNSFFCNPGMKRERCGDCRHLITNPHSMLRRWTMANEDRLDENQKKDKTKKRPCSGDK